MNQSKSSRKFSLKYKIDSLVFDHNPRRPGLPQTITEYQSLPLTSVSQKKTSLSQRFPHVLIIASARSLNRFSYVIRAQKTREGYLPRLELRVEPKRASETANCSVVIVGKQSLRFNFMQKSQNRSNFRFNFMQKS